VILVPAALAIFLWLLAIVTVVLFLSKTWWMPELVSAHGIAVDDQFEVTLAIAGLIFLLAHLALGYFIWRYRRGTEQRAIYFSGNHRLEAGWTIATGVLFIGLGVQGNGVWARYLGESIPANAVSIEITAQQFAWNIRYPGADGLFGRTDPKLIDDSIGNYAGIDPKDPAGSDDILTQNIMAVPVNRAVRIVLRSKDVTHSFFVPQLRVKQDAVPGLNIPVHFTATKTGEYEIACAELCGMQHYKMRGRLQVVSEPEFATWLKSRAAQQE
jgi:cytochrome c oxidase subunit 2